MVSLLIIISVFVFTGAALAVPEEVIVKVDGNIIEFTDAKPFLADGRTHVPTRFVAEQLGATLEWEAITQTITITKDDLTINLQVGKKKVTVNGEEKELDTQIFLKDSRTYAPVRFVTETLGAAVKWNPETATVVITTETIAEGKPMLEELAKQIDGAIIPERSNGDIVLFKADGKADFEDCDIFVTCDDSYMLTFENYKDTSLKAAKEVVQMLFTNSYEEVYKQIVKVVNGEIGPLGVWDYIQWHDDRIIKIKKYDTGTSAFIGKKGIEYQ